MNLWNIFPDFLLRLLHIDNILLLPLAAIPLYLYIFYALVRYPKQRVSLAIFVLLTLVASIIMYYNKKPKTDDFIAPLALLIVMAMPLLMLLIQLSNKSYVAARIWAISTLAGCVHSISWYLWILALARS